MQPDPLMAALSGSRWLIMAIMLLLSAALVLVGVLVGLGIGSGVCALP